MVYCKYTTFNWQGGILVALCVRYLYYTLYFLGVCCPASCAPHPPPNPVLVYKHEYIPWELFPQ